MTGWDEGRLHGTRRWLDQQHEREMRKRSYVRLPRDHPMFDAEDLPHWSQRWFAEGVGAVILIALVAGAAVFAFYVMPNPLPDWLASLTGWVQSWR